MIFKQRKHKKVKSSSIEENRSTVEEKSPKLSEEEEEDVIDNRAPVSGNCIQHLDIILQNVI